MKDISSLVEQFHTLAAASKDSGDLEDVEAAISLIVTRRGERREAAERQAKHEAILAQCRTALDKFEALDKQLEKAELDLITVDSVLESAMSHVGFVRDAQPQPNAYPKEEELANWREQVADAEARLEAASAARREAVGLRDTLAIERVKARDEFNRLQWTERNLRPRGQQSMGALSGVR